MSSSTPSLSHVRRVAIVGTGSRGLMFTKAILSRKSTCSLVAFCDPNPVRVAYYNSYISSSPSIPAYHPDNFLEMLENESVDTLVVTCIDALHHKYIVPALERGIRVISEKPLTTSIENCRLINDTVNRTNGDLTITFNYRYNPVHQTVKQLLSTKNAIGSILSVHFEWLLDTVHGADYFRRWHKQKENSGGLMVHKSGHHFDLVNWWIDDEPVEVAGMGRTAFYGSENGKKFGWVKGEGYERARGSREATNDPFALDIEADETLKALYADAEKEDGYYRDQNVFSSNVTIEDDMSVLVRYSSGATVTYHLTAYSPWEGYRVMFNGSKGRLELTLVESSFRIPQGPKITGGTVHGTEAFPNAGEARISVHPLWGKPWEVPVEYEHEGHGGGDERMLSDLFGPRDGESVESKRQGDEDRQKARVRDGTMALAIGLAANESFRTKEFVKIDERKLGIQ